MTHLEKKKEFEVTKTISNKEPDDPELEKGIYSVLTVEELGLLLKVQKDTGLLKNKNMKQGCPKHRRILAYKTERKY